MTAKKPSAKSPKATTKKAAPKAKKPTKLDILTEADEILRKIEANEVACQEHYARMVEIKEEFKAAKEAYTHQVNEGRRLARARKEKLPLFDQPKKETAMGEWEKLPIEAAGIVDDDAGRLLDAGVKTLGDLQAKFKKLDAELKKTGQAEDEPTKRVREKLDFFLKAREQDAAPKPEPAKKNADPDGWKLNAVAAAGFSDKQIDALDAADIRTLGELQAAMTRDGEWWAKNRKISNRNRYGIEDAFNVYVTKCEQTDEASKAA